MGGEVSGSRDGDEPLAPGVPALLSAVREQTLALGAAAVGGLRVDATEGAVHDDGGAQLVDLIAAVSQLVSAAEAISARAAVELDRLRRAQEAAAGVPAKRRGRGVGAEVALARRESASRGRSFLGLAKVLCTEMPQTMRELAAGRLTPWRAVMLVKESACLDLEDRVRLDAELCGDPSVLDGLGDRAVAAAAARWAAREDPASVVARRSRAEADRRVSLRPAPDTMTYLTALLPVAQGVAAFAALSKHADSARAAGDERSRGQVMADALVSRVSGQEEAAAPGVLVNLVMTDAALFHGGDEPGWLPGHGPVPAGTARAIVADAARAGEHDRHPRERGSVRHGRTSGVGAFVRRLYLAPASGALVGMDARTREAPDGLADLIQIRDGGSCRMPWCDAPGRHTDHIVPAARGGATSEQNLQQLCEAHNYAKEAPGWSAQPLRYGATPAQVVTRTPSGHTYTGKPPPIPGAPSQVHEAALTRIGPSPAENLLAEVLSRWRAA